MLDSTERHFYGLTVRIAIGEKQGIEFQDFFVRVASRLWGTDFEAIRPLGSIGDDKCDGYRNSTQAIYQAYAPRSFEPAKLRSKVCADFKGALAIWGKNMKCWTLVHNDREGLDAGTHRIIRELREQYPDILIEIVGFEQLHGMTLQLPKDDLRDIFGVVPSSTSFNRLGFGEIHTVVQSIVSIDPEPNLTEPLAPSVNKLVHNELPIDVVELLRRGGIKARLFEQYFSETSHAEDGERIAELFRKDYARRRSDVQDPFHIFQGLLNLAGGIERPAKEAAAVIGLVSYLFHRCDIFEDAPSDIVTP